MRISSECARSARSSSVSCQTRPSRDTLAAATGALTRLATGGVNQPGPSSVSSVTAAYKPCSAVSEVKGKESMLQWLLKCLSKPRQGYLQTRANCRSGSLYLPELLIAHA